MFYYTYLPPVVHQWGMQEIRDYIEDRSRCQYIDTMQSLEEIQKGFNYNTRSEIREAEKEKFEIRINKNYDEFVSLFEKQVKYKHMKVPPLPVNQLKQQEHLLVSVWNGGTYPLACDYAGIQDESLYMIFICNARCLGENQRLVSRASRLAHWEAIKWAKDHHYEGVSVGALSEDAEDRGNIEFKKGFGGYEKEITAFIKIYNPLLKFLWRWRK